jgi:hypothetical protein
VAAHGGGGPARQPRRAPLPVMAALGSPRWWTRMRRRWLARVAHARRLFY